MAKPNYQSYTLEELYDAHSNIDRNSYPDRYQKILSEIELRKAAEPTITAQQKQSKPKRKRTNKEKIVTSSVILIAAALCIYYEKIPGKHDVISMDKSPYAFWITILACVGLAVGQLLTLERNLKPNGNDT